MKLRIEKSVIVITPSIGSSTLYSAIYSIQKQTYKNVKHLVVSDGGENFEDVQTLCEGEPGVIATSCPFNTGGSGFYGHRIYAAYPHLVDADYILFLDEDNWFEPDHIESLVDLLESNPIIDFAYSYRKIHNKIGEYLIDDNCESLGSIPIWGDEKRGHLVDTSSYAFRRSFIQKTCHLWHSGWGADRDFYTAVSSFANLGTKKHTLCYRLDGNENSVTKEFFARGNEIMKSRNV